MLGREYYEDYCKRFNAVYEWLVRRSESREQVISGICDLRGYSEEVMGTVLEDMGIIKLVPEVSDIGTLGSKGLADLGLFSNGKFLLEGRYIFPVRDMLGNVVALIGWYHDEKRYITSKSAMFSKSGMFYGMEQLSKTGIGRPYYLVEGIFDSISLRAMGVNAVAMMGISSSSEKMALYGLFGRIVAIPDADGEGRKVVRYDKWKLPAGSSYMLWRSDKRGKLTVKDIDDFCKKYTRDVVVDVLLESMSYRGRIVEYVL